MCQYSEHMSRPFFVSLGQLKIFGRAYSNVNESGFFKNSYVLYNSRPAKKKVFLEIPKRSEKFAVFVGEPIAQFFEAIVYDRGISINFPRVERIQKIRFFQAFSFL